MSHRSDLLSGDEIELLLNVEKNEKKERSNQLRKERVKRYYEKNKQN
ncbi:hypothetical protein AVEN_185152-1, partial [Araneus ventricosus]